MLAVLKILRSDTNEVDEYEVTAKTQIRKKELKQAGAPLVADESGVGRRPETERALVCIKIQSRDDDREK